MIRRRIEATRAALSDFDDIYQYIAGENPRAAGALLRDLEGSIQLLVEQPKLGRPFRDRRLRLLPRGHYLIFYRERPGVIEIVRVIDGRRHIPDILDEL